MNKTRKNFDPQFRLDAAQLVVDQGYTINNPEAAAFDEYGCAVAVAGNGDIIVTARFKKPDPLIPYCSAIPFIVVSARSNVARRRATSASFAAWSG